MTDSKRRVPPDLMSAAHRFSDPPPDGSRQCFFPDVLLPTSTVRRPFRSVAANSRFSALGPAPPRPAVRCQDNIRAVAKAAVSGMY